QHHKNSRTFQLCRAPVFSWKAQSSIVGPFGTDRQGRTAAGSAAPAMAEDHFYAVEYVSESWQDDGWLFEGLPSFSAETIAPTDVVPSVDGIVILKEPFALGECATEADIESDLFGDDENVANLTVDTETAEIVEKMILNEFWTDENVEDDETDGPDTFFLSEAPSDHILAPPREQILLEVVHEDAFTVPGDLPAPPDVVIVKTRSGRVSKPTAYLAKDARRLVQAEASEAAEIAVQVANTPPTAGGTAVDSAKRTPCVADEYRCATCGKMYVGRRIQRHLRDNPGHKTMQQVAQEQWAAASDQQAGHGWEQFWLRTLQEHQLGQGGPLAAGEQGRRLALALSALVRAVRKTYPPAMVPCTAQTDGAMYVDEYMADLLAARAGFYRIEPTASNQTC
uniref:Uncharacterized protein n=1 Tax=Anopheles dirus TaxID=7168 RepID=A0A182N8I7_9DIPT